MDDTTGNWKAAYTLSNGDSDSVAGQDRRKS